MIVLEYPAEMGIPQREVSEADGKFDYGDQLFLMPFSCGNCGQGHEIIFGFERMQPHDDGPRKVYRFGGISF